MPDPQNLPAGTPPAPAWSVALAERAKKLIPEPVRNAASAVGGAISGAQGAIGAAEDKLATGLEQSTPGHGINPGADEALDQTLRAAPQVLESVAIPGREFGPADESFGIEGPLYREAPLDQVRSLLDSGMDQTGHFVTPNRELALSQQGGPKATVEYNPSIVVRSGRRKPGLVGDLKEFTIHGNPNPTSNDIQAIVLPKGTDVAKIQKYIGPSRTRMFDWDQSEILDDGSLRIPKTTKAGNNPSFEGLRVHPIKATEGIEPQPINPQEIADMEKEHPGKVISAENVNQIRRQEAADKNVQSGLENKRGDEASQIREEHRATLTPEQEWANNMVSKSTDLADSAKKRADESIARSQAIGEKTKASATKARDEADEELHQPGLHPVRRAYLSAMREVYDNLANGRPDPVGELERMMGPEEPLSLEHSLQSLQTALEKLKAANKKGQPSE